MKINRGRQNAKGDLNDDSAGIRVPITYLAIPRYWLILLAAALMASWLCLVFWQNPDDRFLNAAVALKTLKADYFIVETYFELGDKIVFLDEKGDLFHAAVYIADNLVLSKNGISAMAPWTLMTSRDIIGDDQRTCGLLFIGERIFRRNEIWI
jgi:hypothetical protein